MTIFCFELNRLMILSTVECFSYIRTWGLLYNPLNPNLLPRLHLFHAGRLLQALGRVLHNPAQSSSISNSLSCQALDRVLHNPQTLTRQSKEILKSKVPAVPDLRHPDIRRMMRIILVLWL